MIYLLLFLSLFFPSRKDPEYAKLSDKITFPFSVDMMRTYGLKEVGRGGGFYSNIDKIIFIYTSKKYVSQNEAREMYVKIVEDLLQRFNTNPSVRPYLNNFPFEPKNTDILIEFAPDSPIDFINLNQYTSNVRYHLKKEPGDINCPVIEEPYDEAYRIVFGKERGK